MEHGWSDGQVELFRALGVICEKVGRERADGMLLLLRLQALWVIWVVSARGMGEENIGDFERGVWADVGYLQSYSTRGRIVID